MSYVLCLMSYVLCLMSYFLCLMSDVLCLMSYVLCTFCLGFSCLPIIVIHPFVLHLKVWWHDVTLFVYFSYFITYIHSITFIQYIYPSPFAEASLHFFIACLLSGEYLPVVPSRESNSGLPYSKPTRYQLSNAAP